MDMADDRIVNGKITYQYPEVSFSEPGKYYSSEVVQIAGFNCWIEIGKAESADQPGKSFLSFWCKCQPLSDMLNQLMNPNGSSESWWKCYAELEFRLVPQNKDVKKADVISWSLSDVLTPESACLGFPEFEDWKSIRDTRKGYCVRDTILVEVIIREMHPFVTTTAMPAIPSTINNDITTYDLRNFLPNLPLPDVTFAIGSVYVLAHSQILQRFRGFRQRLGKQGAIISKYLILPDMKVPAFLSIISFLYKGQLVLNDKDKNHLVDLMSAASSLNFTAILKTGVLLMTWKEVQSVMEIAIRDTNNDLLEDCWPVFSKNADLVMYRTQYKKISKSLLKQILVKEEIKCDELDLFLTTLDWSEEECKRQGLLVTPENQRALLENDIYNIRFPCMELADVKCHVKQSGILTKEEMKLIKKFICKKLRKGAKTDLKFPTTKRKFFSK